MDVTLSPRARAIVVWLGVLAGFILLLEAAHALRPFAWAIITAYIFHPFVSFVHRRTRVPKHLIAIWLYLMLGLLITLATINIVPSVIEQAKQLQDQAPDAVGRVNSWLEQNQSDRLRQMGVQPDFLDQRISEVSAQVANRVSNLALPLLFGTFSVAVEILIYFVASFYFIVYGDRFVYAARSILKRRYHAEADRLLQEINFTLGRYIRGQLLLVLIMSTATFIALSILGVQYALVLALATGFLELIPLIGPWSAGAITIGFSLFQDTTPFGWSHLTLALVIAVVYFALRQLEDTLIIPTVIGRIVHLHPLLVIFVIVVGTSLGGVLGLVTAVPIAAVIKILVSFFYAKVMARDQRHICPIRSRNDLDVMVAQFREMPNQSVVLVVEPDALAYDDLEVARRARDEADEFGIDLVVVTPDAVAGTIFTAAGVRTETIAAALPGRERGLALPDDRVGSPAHASQP